MPFVSKRQYRWAFATGQPFARRWARETGKRKLPEHKAADPAAGEPADSAAPANTGTPGKRTPSERARLAALARWGKYRAKGKAKGGGKGRKPAKTPEQIEAEKRQAALENRNKALTAQGVDQASQDAMNALASGQSPDEAGGQALIDAGLAEKGADGTVRLTAEGRQVYNQASQGDEGLVRETLSKARDKVEAKRKAEAEAAKPKGGGGGGSKKPTEEEKQAEAERKKQEKEAEAERKKQEKEAAAKEKQEQTARDTADAVGLDGDTLDALRNAATEGGADNSALAQLGFIDDAGEATPEGRNALAALEQGDKSKYRAALVKAQAKLQAAFDKMLKDLEKSSKMYRYSAMKHMPGGHDQRSHGRSTARRGAARAAYSASRAAGGSIEQARAAARDVSQVYANKQRIANIDKQLAGSTTESTRTSLEAERTRLQADIAMREARTEHARNIETPEANVRGRQSPTERAMYAADDRVAHAVAMRDKVTGPLADAKERLAAAQDYESRTPEGTSYRRQAAKERAAAQREVRRLEKEQQQWEGEIAKNRKLYEAERAKLVSPSTPVAPRQRLVAPISGGTTNWTTPQVARALKDPSVSSMGFTSPNGNQVLIVKNGAGKGRHTISYTDSNGRSQMRQVTTKELSSTVLDMQSRGYTHNFGLEGKSMTEAQDSAGGVLVARKYRKRKRQEIKAMADVLSLINAQITKERYAEAAYTALANWADSNAFPGLQAWAKAAASEERGHAQIFIDYLNDRASVELQPIAAPPVNWGDYGSALKTVLDLERSVTASITQIAAVASNSMDYATVKLAQEMLMEQVQAEKELTVYIQRVSRGAPIDLLDDELFEDANG